MAPIKDGPKALSNQMKARGLTRLRWYCQVCEKPCRDQHGFEQHCNSPAHVRRILEVGDDFQNVRRDYTRQFQTDFIQLLRTSHGEKAVALNSFYQVYIADRHHIHLNSTQFSSLTDFARHLGREGLCRVTEDEGDKLKIAWIDNSPENLRRRDAVRKMERQAHDDEERERKALEAQIERARQAAHLHTQLAKERKEQNGGGQDAPDAPDAPDVSANVPEKKSTDLQVKFKLGEQRKKPNPVAGDGKRKNVFRVTKPAKPKPGPSVLT